MRLLERALDQTAGLIAAIEPGQAGLATPCAGWDVRTLVSHLRAGPAELPRGRARRDPRLARARRGDRRRLGGGVPGPGRAVRAAWRAADLDWLVAGPGGEAPLRARADQQITELAAHDWDLARATGQDLAGWTRRWPSTRSPGPAACCGPSSGGRTRRWGRCRCLTTRRYDRLAGWFGRDPGWTPSRIAPRSSVRAVAREGPYQVSRRPGTRTTRWAGNSSGPSSGVNR